MQVSLTDTPLRSPQVTHEGVGEEAILIHLDTGIYYTLNDTGALFWELLDGQRTIADCAQRIAEQYDVTAAEVEADLLELADQFKNEGLIIV